MWEFDTTQEINNKSLKLSEIMLMASVIEYTIEQSNLDLDTTTCIKTLLYARLLNIDACKKYVAEMDIPLPQVLSQEERENLQKEFIGELDDDDEGDQ